MESIKKCPKGLGLLLAVLLIVIVSMAAMCTVPDPLKPSIKQKLEIVEFSLDKTTLKSGEGTVMFFEVKSPSTNTKNINLLCTVSGQPEESIRFDKKDFQMSLRPGETTKRTRVDILWTSNGDFNSATINVILSVAGTTDDKETINISKVNKLTVNK